MRSPSGPRTVGRHGLARPGTRRLWLGLWLLGTGLAACKSPAPDAVAAEPGVGGPALAQETFDAVWETVREHHFDQELGGLDWEALRDEFRPRALRARSQEDLREVLDEMLERLDQSHFGVLPRGALPQAGSTETRPPEALAGGLGLEVRVAEGRALVWRLDPGGPARRAGVATGWELVSVDGTDVAARSGELLGVGSSRKERERVVRTVGWILERFVGPVGSEVRLVFRDGEDRPVTLDLEREERDVVAHTFAANLPTFYLRFEEETLFRKDRRIGHLRWTNWFLPMAEEVDAAIDRMRGHDGLVIDLRGNTGGAVAMTMGTAGHFFTERTDLGTMTMRDGELVVRAFPRNVSADARRVEPYAGPLAILIDGLSASASEVFAGGMQAAGRARVFGSTSMGAVLPATTVTLPNGDAFLYAMADFRAADGTLLEGRGVVPDVAVPLTRSDLLAGRDAALEAAVAWILDGPPGAPPQDSE